MPAVALAILRALAIFGRAIVPWLARFGRFLKLDKLWIFIVYWLHLWGGKSTIEKAASMGFVFVGLALHAGIMLVFWTWVAGSGLKELFSSNPLTGAPAGALYLASHAFPLKFMFSTAIAFIIWRLSFIQLAVVFSRMVKLLIGY